MKRLIALVALYASPALAHPGHPAADGAAGHLMAHLMLTATLMAVLAAGLVLLMSLRKPIERRATAQTRR